MGTSAPAFHYKYVEEVRSGKVPDGDLSRSGARWIRTRQHQLQARAPGSAVSMSIPRGDPR